MSRTTGFYHNRSSRIYHTLVGGEEDYAKAPEGHIEKSFDELLKKYSGELPNKQAKEGIVSFISSVNERVRAAHEIATLLTLASNDYELPMRCVEGVALGLANLLDEGLTDLGYVEDGVIDDFSKQVEIIQARSK